MRREINKHLAKKNTVKSINNYFPMTWRIRREKNQANSQIFNQ